ncbi:Tyrosine-kinase transforming protein [Nymphaea thermarum]|nr:Tyrosine-kinase transforming protein [Nymphaea thermarum]
MPPTTKLHQFSFNDLSIATRKFSKENLIGQGGFGYVYKGWIDEITFSPTKPGVGITVAVKSLKTDSFQGHKEWVSEVTYLDEFHHPNLVKLVGFCMEGEHRLLAYEYMQKGTLENHLFRSKNSFSLQLTPSTSRSRTSDDTVYLQVVLNLFLGN